MEGGPGGNKHHHIVSTPPIGVFYVSHKSLALVCPPIGEALTYREVTGGNNEKEYQAIDTKPSHFRIVHI